MTDINYWELFTVLEGISALHLYMEYRDLGGRDPELVPWSEGYEDFERMVGWKAREDVVIELLRHLFIALENWWDTRCILDATIATRLQEEDYQHAVGGLIKEYVHGPFREHLMRVGMYLSYGLLPDYSNVY